MAPVGIEMEMPVADQATGDSHRVSRYFENMLESKRARGENPELETLKDTPIAVVTAQIKTGLDNAFNNLESSIGPIAGGECELTNLHECISRELRDIEKALTKENAAIINLAEHPNAEISSEFYFQMRAPKAIYDYWIDYRGWNHMVGIDAKAHNSPSTEVSFESAVAALNTILAVSPAFIALYGNSPFECGQISGCRETRLTIWCRMFGHSRFSGDFALQEMPPAPFGGLRDYFQWMFGHGTNMYFVVPSRSKDYKHPKQIVLIEGDPPLLEFLRKPVWRGKEFKSDREVIVKPTMKDLEFHQFAQFLDARIRYAIREPDFPVTDFWEAMEKSNEHVADLFARVAKYCYIEGRAPGANFPDPQIAALSDARIARSVVISPSAIQKGLLQNLLGCERLMAGYAWVDLIGLRQEAIKHGLAAKHRGITVKNFCQAVLETAAAGLPGDEHWMLCYPQFVLSTGKNGADRALEAFEREHGTDLERIKNVILKRRMVIP